MKVHVRGKGVINFTKDDFASSGGEAKIYKKNGLSFKIFHEKKKMIPEAKIGELQVLQRPNIIKPLDILLDDKNSPIGFSSIWAEGHPMCKIFVTGFRKRNNISDQMTETLVDNIRETIAYIHSHKILIVDGNEMNYIIGNDFVTPYFIDVNAWQTPSFPATAIMDSIRDFKTKGFSEMTDWFGFGIISCWLFVGVHPFRGNHPDYKEADIHERTKRRMLDGISIFNSDVGLAPNARINSVPSNYKEWYIQIFEKGQRMMPPVQGGIIIAVPIRPVVIKKTDNFRIEEILSFDSEVFWYSKIDGKSVVKTSKDFYIDGHKFVLPETISPEILANSNLIFSEKYQRPVFSRISNNQVVLGTYNSKLRDITPPTATEIMIVKNHLYYRNGGKLVEMKMSHFSNSEVVPLTKEIWNISPNSSTLFAGIIYQNLLGVPYISIPMPNPDKRSAFYTRKVPEIRGKVIDGKFDNHIAALYIYDQGKYIVLIIRFDKDFDKYDTWTIDVSDIGDINMTTLDNGVCILIPENGRLDVFGNKPFNNDVKTILDPVITSDMRLCKDGTRAMFHQGEKIYTISMK